MDTRPPPEVLYRMMRGLMNSAINSASNTLAKETKERVDVLAQRFDDACEGSNDSDLTIIVFHLELEDAYKKVDYVDISFDQSLVNYKVILEYHFQASRMFNPSARIIFICGQGDDVSFVPDDVVIVRLPLKSEWLMYERVVSLTAYARSKSFTSNTVMLDSDAIPNYSLKTVFELNFDVALTYRQPSTLMTLNEGVIFVGFGEDGRKSQKFFERYLATYEQLCENEFVIKQYKEIRRWRGGQLALNGAGKAIGFMSEFDQTYANEALVRYLQGEDYNFSVIVGESYDLERLRRKYILHLKGPMKPDLKVIVEFQRLWHGELLASGLIR
ncbi:MAG: hypothetical protein RIC29_03240 [Rhodospirillaceae bacterium]